MGFGKFGKLWKFIMPFPEPGQFWRREVFQNGYGKVLDFCFWKILKYPIMDIS